MMAYRDPVTKRFAKAPEPVLEDFSAEIRERPTETPVWAIWGLAFIVLSFGAGLGWGLALLLGMPS